MSALRSSAGARRAVGAIALIAAALVGTTGCVGITLAPDAAVAVVESTPSPSPTAEAPISVLVAGDSLASGGPWDAMEKDPGSWTYYLGDELAVVGGWRRDGATSALIAERIPSEQADALIVMAGTNDIRQDIATSDIVANVEAITSRVDVVVVALAAVPPQSGRQVEVVAANSALESLAAARGWEWIDPWMLYRTEDGWAANGSPDGVHGSIASYQYAGTTITEFLVRRFEGSAP